MSKPALCFIPGWGADRRCWQKLEAWLCLHFDCEHVELPYDSQNLTSWPSELEKLAAQIKYNSVVVAWSLGGMLATKLASLYPEKVKALVLIACNPSFVTRDSWRVAMAQTTFERFCSDFVSSPKRMVKKFNALQAQGYIDTKKYMRLFHEISALTPSRFENASNLLFFLAEINNVDTLFELEQPTLNFFSDGDALVPIEVIELIEDTCARLDKKNIQCQRIIDSGHAPHLSHAQLMSDEIVEFLGLPSARYTRDKKRVADSFSKASQSYDSAAQLQLKVAYKLMAWTTHIQGRSLDLGCGTGYCLEALDKKRSAAEGNHSHGDFDVGLDISLAMLHNANQKLIDSEGGGGNEAALRWCNADFEYLPFCDESFDNIISSLAIQWCEQLPYMFNEASRVLKPQGQFVVSSLGPDTLSELNKSWLTAEPDYIHVNRFSDASAVMSAASEAGFEVELFSVDFEVLEYKRAIDLMRDLKAIGAHNVNKGSRRGLTGKKALSLVEQAYNQYRMVNGFLPATYQVYYWVFKKRRVLL